MAKSSEHSLGAADVEEYLSDARLASFSVGVLPIPDMVSEQPIVLVLVR